MSNTSRSDERTTVALVATRGRRESLLSRAIPSILQQTRPPDRLLIVVDQSKEEMQASEFEELEARIKSLAGSSLRVTVLRNVRTLRRAAGAWNTGLDHLQRDPRLMEHPELCFAAILDDDDSWEPDHIQRCLQVVESDDCGMAVAGLVRHDAPEAVGRPQAIPYALDARELFIRGQHIQGSNLFIRLDVMLKAGCFDEHLPSCTDRDLCIRLAALPTLKVGRVDKHTVHHFADARSDRLSTPGSPDKLEGLDRFWRKHADHFDDAARAQAADRAQERFGWSPPAAEARGSAIPPLLPPSRPVAMIVGFVTDASPRNHVQGLLADLLELASDPSVSKIRVVVVENGPLPRGEERPLRALVERFAAQGLDIDLVTIERQRRDWEAGRLIDGPDPTACRLPIAVTRTILNTYVARAAAEIPGTWAWILDDDKRLMVYVDGGDGVVLRRPSPDLGALCRLQDEGVDVVIGPDTDAAPLPFTATLRGQCIDLLHHLRLLERVEPSSSLPDRSVEDSASRTLLRDSYYDLSKSTEHLETPFSLPRTQPELRACDSLAELGSKCARLLAGESVIRPLRVRPEHFKPAPSTQRGGSTVFFDPRVLMVYPQTLARIGDRYVRRSDMLVTQLMRDQGRMRIVMHAAAGVLHDRSGTEPTTLEDETLRQDVLGYALYRAADEVMGRRTTARQREELLAWTAGELDDAVRLVRKYIAERLAAFTLSGWRIAGLAESIEAVTSRLMRAGSVWTAPEHAVHLVRMQEEVQRIGRTFEPNAVAQCAERIRSCVSDEEIRAAFSSMDGLISGYRATLEGGTPADAARLECRERLARNLLTASYGVKSARLLGAGGEGIVFTDGEDVYKVLDLLKRRSNHDAVATLTKFREQRGGAQHLYPLKRVDVQDGTLVLAYPFEPSEPYLGGRGREIIGLLRECKARGVVFRNMHPKNLRVSASGLKLIDYGSDLRSYTDAGYRAMAERAWLTWRWPHRTDLEGLMRRALTDETLPEMCGFERFWAAVLDENPSATQSVADMVDNEIPRGSVSRVLDYGCGKGALSARRLASAGARTVGFDPGEGMLAKWSRHEPLLPNLFLTMHRTGALSHGPFDAVICSLVLCELGDGPEYEQVLLDLRAAVSDDGVVMVTVCNPFATFGGPTALHRRRDIPEGMTYDDAFWYTENADQGSGRREFHRPMHRIERDLLRHGLEVQRRVQSRSVDVERFEPASDFLTLVCRPAPAPKPPRSISLVIKTCAMEAATAERQVTHLVSQLEGPRTFDERILVIDSLPDGFVRQHSGANMEALTQAAERLARQRTIDRVVYGPGPGEHSRRVLKNWFGVESDATHTTRGAPLTAPLLALETCRGEYILQVDSDLLISRQDRSHDYLGEMIEALEARPDAVTASLNIVQQSSRPFTSGDKTPWRVEVRGCLLHKARLLSSRPFPNVVEEGKPGLAWHRSIDLAVAEGRLQSLRGGDYRTAFVHPPNQSKRSVLDWMLVLDAVERRAAPPEQVGQVDLVGGPIRWIPRERTEPFIFVITGRNVPTGRAARCLESIAAQKRGDWGAVLVDDGSSTLARDSLRLTAGPWRDQITLLQPRERRGQLANMLLAIRHVCTNPESVIITLDLDDALIGCNVLDRLRSEYDAGADVTIGSMLRTDKHVEYPVNVEDPRRTRGGNVWQHLRTFRKRLFDAIPEDSLKIDGRYVDIAVDWAFMIPIVEMSARPMCIREPLYLYEPSGLGKGSDRGDRERQIAAIIAKTPCAAGRRAGGVSQSSAENVK